MVRSLVLQWHQEDFRVDIIVIIDTGAGIGLYLWPCVIIWIGISDECAMRLIYWADTESSLVYSMNM